MNVAALALFGLSGAAAGFLAGLFGIGGGAVLVPLLYLLLDTSTGGEGATVVAHATSLAVIVPTAGSALLRFQAAGLVPWRLVGLMGGGAAVGAAATTRLVPHLPEAGLRGAFALFLAAVGLRMLRRADPGGSAAPGPRAGAAGASVPATHGREPPSPGEADEVGASLRRRKSTALSVVGGIGVGVVSAALGVGGGTLAIPILLFGLRLDVRRVAAASMGVVALAALAGTAAYLAGPGPGDGGVTVGWVNVPAALGLMPGAILGARWGADVNTRLPAGRLRTLFALLLLAIAARIFFVLATG